MGYSDWGLLGPLCLFLNQYFNNFLPEHFVLWMALCWCTIDMLRYCSQVIIIRFLHTTTFFFKFLCLLQICLEICDHMCIELFRIPYPPKSSNLNSAAAAASSSLSSGVGLGAPSLTGGSGLTTTNSANAANNKRQTKATKRNNH